MTDKAAAENQDKMVSKYSKLDQAAVLLMTLGEADAAEILRHMGPKEVQFRHGDVSTFQYRAAQSRSGSFKLLMK